MSQSNVSKKDSYTLLYILIGVVLLLWLGSWLAIQGFYGWDKENNRGTFGDMFGAVNAIFSGLAFAGLIFTIHLQRKDLNIQMEVLRSQTEEMSKQSIEAARTADQLEQQQSLMNYQLAQSTVNNLIEIKKNLLANTILSINHTTFTGQAGLYQFRNRISMNDVFLAPDEYFHKQLKEYLRTFFFIMQFINDSNLNDAQKELLARTLDLLTTDDEVFIIYHLNNKNQHELALLKSLGFLTRYENI